MEETAKDSLRQLCDITLRSYMGVAGTDAGTDVGGVLWVLAAIGKNVYYATARDGSPGIPETEEALVHLTLEAYVLPFGHELIDAMVAEGVPRDSISSTFRLNLAEEMARRVYSAGYRPTVQVYGAR